MNEKSDIKIRIEGNSVVLTVDGRETVKWFMSQSAAQECYDKFKARIVAAEAVPA